MTKITCLMCLYNKQKDVSRAIESVLSQKTRYKFELLIIDDGSTDNSLKIVKEYEKKYPDIIKVIQNEINLGLLRTTLKGYLLIEDSDYYCVLDPDDHYIYNKKFEDAINFLETHPDYTQYCANITLRTKEKDNIWINSKKKEITQDFSNGKAGKGIFIQTSGSIFKNPFKDKKISEKIKTIMNLPFPESFCADAFRQELSLSQGKMYFKNHIESVYSFHNEGLHSGTPPAVLDFRAALYFYSMAHYFTDEKEYYLNEFYIKLKMHFAKYGKEACLKEKEDFKKLVNYLCIKPEQILQYLSHTDIVIKKPKNIKHKLMLYIYTKLRKKLLRKGYICD